VFSSVRALLGVPFDAAGSAAGLAAGLAGGLDVS